jgi:hypothetical protein
MCYGAAGEDDLGIEDEDEDENDLEGDQIE